MLKRSRLLSLLILLLIIHFVLPIGAYAQNTPYSGYESDEPYIFPIRPGTDEWNALPQNLDAKIAATQVPEEMLATLSTLALVNTVLDYPLLVNLSAFATPEEGFKSILSYSNCLQALAQRPDAVQVLNIIIEEIDNSGIISGEYIEPENYNIVTRYFHAITLKNGIELENNGNPSTATNLTKITIQSLSKTLLMKYTLSRELSLLYSTGTITTPGGATVTVYNNMSAADRAVVYGLSVAQYLVQIQADHVTMQSTYSVTVSAPPSPAYNCHNYAWRTTGQTSAWITNPSPYWGTNGGYSAGSAAVGSKVYYSGTYAHSAIVYALPSAGSPNTYVRSKWADLGLYNHAVSDCPYTGTRTYYN